MKTRMATENSSYRKIFMEEISSLAFQKTASSVQMYSIRASIYNDSIVFKTAIKWTGGRISAFFVSDGIASQINTIPGDVCFFADGTFSQFPTYFEQLHMW